MTQEQMKITLLNVTEGFFTWFKNGCTSGTSLDKAIEDYSLRSEGQQQSLRDEYNAIIQNQSEGLRWAGPFEG